MFLVFLFIYIFVYYRFQNGIYNVPGSIQFNVLYYLKYLGVLVNDTRPSEIIFTKIPGYKRIYGYSCRQLFRQYIKIKKENNNDLTIGVTPIQHTSFRDIIEEFFDEDNIYIFDLDETYNKVIVNDDINQKQIDIILITHVWGNQLDIDDLECFRDKSIFLEDAVLGGVYNNKIVTNSDIYFHSFGMDKRPGSIYGGYLDIKDSNKDDILDLNKSILALPLPNLNEKINRMFDLGLLYIIYNCIFIQQNIKLFSYLLNYKLIDLVHKVRKSKPGFQHDNYMKCPNQFMVNKMIDIDNNVEHIEQLFIMKNENFKSYYDNKIIQKYFPWKCNLKKSTLPYNPILINVNDTELFLDYFNKNSIPICKNPTYTTFKNSSNRYKRFLDSIYYLPNLYKMNYSDQIILIKFVEKYIDKSKKIRELN